MSLKKVDSFFASGFPEILSEANDDFYFYESVEAEYLLMVFMRFYHILEMKVETEDSVLLLQNFSRCLVRREWS